MTMKYLVCCVLLSALICIAQISGSTIVIGGALLCFLLSLFFASQHNMAVSMLLYFLPWSPLLKLQQGSISFYTIGFMLVCLLYLLRTQMKLDKGALITAMLLVDVTLFTKFIRAYSFDMSYIMFLFLLLLFPSVIRQAEKKEQFPVVTLFFSVGIIVAALSAKELVAFSNIARYIDVYSWNIVTRRSGYYGDPNFYSAQISAALAGTLLLVLKEEKKKKMFLYMALALLLLYCGFLSASKAFIITIVLMFTLWILEVLLMKNRISFKLAILLGLAVLVLFAMFSGLFTDVLEVISFRFGQSSDLSGLTTGRTERWSLYFHTIFHDAKQFFLGVGFTNIKLKNVSPHNTLLQILFQFGAVGAMILMCWFISCYKKSKAYLTGNLRLLPIGLLVLGAFLPWMALDMVFFDEFFLIPLFVLMGLKFLNHSVWEGEE